MGRDVASESENKVKKIEYNWEHRHKSTCWTVLDHTWLIYSSSYPSSASWAFYVLSYVYQINSYYPWQGLPQNWGMSPHLLGWFYFCDNPERGSTTNFIEAHSLRHMIEKSKPGRQIKGRNLNRSTQCDLGQSTIIHWEWHKELSSVFLPVSSEWFSQILHVKVFSIRNKNNMKLYVCCLHTAPIRVGLVQQHCSKFLLRWRRI